MREKRAKLILIRYILVDGDAESAYFLRVLNSIIPELAINPKATSPSYHNQIQIVHIFLFMRNSNFEPRIFQNLTNLPLQPQTGNS